MTDQKILGLKNDFSYNDLKKAFRQKALHFHPDKNDNCLKSHLAMIRVNQAYSNLLKILSNKTITKPLHKENKNIDHAYEFYKSGITKFQEIHPSKWKTYKKDGLFNPDAIKTHEQAPLIIESLITKMSEAYHSFSIVVNEYETSEWHSDSLQKMKELEKMTARYIKIKKSYEVKMGETT